MSLNTNRTASVDRNGTLIVRGARVLIPKGTSITGTFPQRKKIAGRSYQVTIFSVTDGWRETGFAPGQKPSITWVGEGGYWHDCDAADVEVVE